MPVTSKSQMKALPTASSSGSTSAAASSTYRCLHRRHSSGAPDFRHTVTCAPMSAVTSARRRAPDRVVVTRKDVSVSQVRSQKGMPWAAHRFTTRSGAVQTTSATA